MEDREKTIQAQIVKLSKEIADINAQIDKLNIEKGLVGTIRVIQQPEVHRTPWAPVQSKYCSSPVWHRYSCLSFVPFSSSTYETPHHRKRPKDRKIQDLFTPDYRIPIPFFRFPLFELRFTMSHFLVPISPLPIPLFDIPFSNYAQPITPVSRGG
jgi:hypothetical protein